MNRKMRRAVRSIGKTLGLEAKPDVQGIQRSYAEACAKLGDLTYKITIAEQGTENLRREARELQNSMKELSKAFSEAMTEQNAAAHTSQGGAAPSSAPSPSKE